MQQNRRLAASSSLYFGSNLVAILSGAITLPVWTRILSQQEYGLLALLNATVSFLVIFSKFGLQHASLRFYSDVRAKKMPYELVSYYSTMVLAGAGFSLVMTSLSVAVGHWLLRSGHHPALMALVVPAGLAVVIQSTNNNLGIFLRAEQKARLYSLMVVFRQYGRFGLAVLMVFVLGATVRSIVIGWILAGSLLLACLLGRMIWLRQIDIRRFSPSLLKLALAYGFPMVWTEVANVTLSLGDRYILQYYLGETSVGVYSVGYNMATLAQSMLSVPLRMAVVPMYLAIWSEQGLEPTRRFIGTALRYYAMFGIPLALGVIWFRREIITLLATSKFLEASVVVPWVIMPLVIHGAYSVFGAGLYIHKKTKVFMYVTAGASVLNLALNFILVPRMGLVGAAQATLVSYLLIAILIFLSARRHMRVSIPWTGLLLFCVLAVAALALSELLPATTSVLLRIPLVIVVYAILVLAADRQSRNALTSLLSR